MDCCAFRSPDLLNFVLEKRHVVKVTSALKRVQLRRLDSLSANWIVLTLNHYQC